MSLDVTLVCTVDELTVTESEVGVTRVDPKASEDVLSLAVDSSAIRSGEVVPPSMPGTDSVAGVDSDGD